jgi:hypothetical protein
MTASVLSNHTHGVLPVKRRLFALVLVSAFVVSVAGCPSTDNTPKSDLTVPIAKDEKASKGAAPPVPTNTPKDDKKP